MKTGSIGAGRMGRPKVARLARGGHDVRVLGRTAEQRRDLAQLGVMVADESVEAGAYQRTAVIHAIALRTGSAHQRRPQNGRDATIARPRPVLDYQTHRQRPEKSEMTAV